MRYQPMIPSPIPWIPNDSQDGAPEPNAPSSAAALLQLLGKAPPNQSHMAMGLWVINQPTNNIDVF